MYHRFGRYVYWHTNISFSRDDKDVCIFSSAKDGKAARADHSTVVGMALLEQYTVQNIVYNHEFPKCNVFAV